MGWAYPGTDCRGQRGEGVAGTDWVSGAGERGAGAAAHRWALGPRAGLPQAAEPWPRRPGSGSAQLLGAEARRGEVHLLQLKPASPSPLD